MKKTLLTIVAFVMTICTWGAKADPTPFTLTQSDGKQLTIILHGDEHMNYVTTTDGVLIVEKNRNYFIAEVLGDGSLRASSLLAHNAGQRTAAELEVIGMQDTKRFFSYADNVARKSRANIAKEPITNANHYFPHTGSPKVLIILADFTDFPFKNSDEVTKAVFNEYLNNETAFGSGSSRVSFPNVGDETLDNNYGSVRRYFTNMSYGAFTPEFDVAAVVHLDNTLVTYGVGKGDRMDLLVPEACQKAHAQGVNFADYDSDNDGYVDLVYIIYAGYAASITGNSEDCIWPKCGTIGGGTYDGKQVYRYGVHSELNGNPEYTETIWKEKRINGIGLFCHEFSHAMGMPDFYPTSESAQKAYNTSMEYWDLMDGGEYTQNGYCPTAYTAWEREAFGWMTIETLTEKGTYTLKNIDKQFEDGKYGEAYRILNDNDADGNEYIIIQNIRRNGWNAKQLGHGMLMYHVDYDASRFSLGSNSVNNEIGHSRMFLIPANGNYISSYDKTHTTDEYMKSHEGHPFPGTSNITELLEVPMYKGGAMKKPFYNITEDTTTGLVTFDFLEKSVDGILDITADNNTSANYYTLDGRIVKNPTKGIYIYNGKKVKK